jgi:hypothetical protein
MSDNAKNDNDYILLYNRDKEMDISKFIERHFIYGIEPEDLFELNRDFIWTQMLFSDKKIIKEKKGKYPESSSDLTIDMWLPSPCVLKVNPSKVTAEMAIDQTNDQVNTSDFYAFADGKIQDIFQNEGYKIDTTTKRSLDCQVFGWFKSLYYTGLDQNGVSLHFDKKHPLNEFSNLSNHIISLATTVTSNGGSFIIKLPVISARSAGVEAIINNPTEGKVIGQLGRATKDETTYKFGKQGEYYVKSEFGDIDSNYFNWLISSNDLLFISFEKLEMETKRNKFAYGDEDNFDINTAISEGVYDMIALVDDVKVVTNSQSSESYVEITGRDLMKLLIEDGSFFFNPSTTSNPSSVFMNESSYGKQGDIREADEMNNTYNNPINRLRRVTGEIDIFANRINMDIGYILKGVISQLANVEIVPGYVFDSWKNERTKFIELQPKKSNS